MLTDWLKKAGNLANAKAFRGGLQSSGLTTWVECKYFLNKTEIQTWTEDRMEDLAAFPG